MVHSQYSLFGRTSWELFHQATGWISKGCLKPSAAVAFQCLIVANGLKPVWCEANSLTSHGGLWTPDIGENPHWRKDAAASFSWQILQPNVHPKYSLTPKGCSKILRLAQMTGTTPPMEIEYLLIKQGGSYPSCDPSASALCAAPPKAKTPKSSAVASEKLLTLSPPC